MRTMYYVVAGDRAAEHEFDRIARCEPEHSQLILPEARVDGGKG